MYNEQNDTIPFAIPFFLMRAGLHQACIDHLNNLDFEDAHHFATLMGIYLRNDKKVP